MVKITCHIFAENVPDLLETWDTRRLRLDYGKEKTAGFERAEGYPHFFKASQSAVDITFLKFSTLYN